VEARVLDPCERSEWFVLRGRNGTRMRLSPIAHYLLENGRAGQSHEELAAGIAQLTGQTVSVPEVEDAYLRLEERVRSIEDRPAPPPPRFWLPVPVIPEAYCPPVAPPVRYLFPPPLPVVL